MIDPKDLPSSPRIITSNDIASYAKRVRAFLNEQLKPSGMLCDDVYVNTVHAVVDPKLTFTQSLVDIGTDSLERGVAPTYNQSLSGVYAKPWTFEDTYRIHTLSLYDVEKMIQHLLDEFRYKWDL